MIDTGMNRSECREVLGRELSEVASDRDRIEVFVTHMHADHLGQAPYVSMGKNDVRLGSEDIRVISASDYWSGMLEYAMMNGFPNQDPEEAIRKHPGYKYGPLGEMRLVPVIGSEVIVVGPYHLEVIHTPGHSKGHMCLYERREKVLFSGDHILGDITPNISLWEPSYDPLSMYISSLKNTRELEVDLTLPGHRSLIKDHRKRIDSLIEHHKDRAHEILDIIGNHRMNAFLIAREMSWDLTVKTYDEFPLMQKWFAMGEALAHLRYLEKRGKVREVQNGNDIVFECI
jgi:glyoxylase-like metal-dependent hydrolase (beta-lactamase superfamily II)